MLPLPSKFPHDIAGAMAVTNYGEAKPEVQLAFMIGYLGGAYANERLKTKAAKIAWAKERAKETCALCSQFDQALAADLVEKLKAIQSAMN